MSKSKIDCIGRLRVGQRVRMTKQRLIQGQPVLNANSWVDDVTEGPLSGLRRVDGGVMVKIGQIEFFVGVTPLGPILNSDHWGRIEILEDTPDQCSLFSAKGGAA